MPRDAAVSERGSSAPPVGKSKRVVAGVGVAMAGIAAFSTLLGNVQSIREAVYPTPSIDGRWEVEDTIADSSLAAYKGLQLTYVISILQSGNTFHAEGEKTRENGKFVPTRCRPTITISGKFLAADQVTATYVTGVRPGCTGRQTGGTFDWKLASHGMMRREGDELRGKFGGDAAETAGESVVSRAPGL